MEEVEEEELVSAGPERRLLRGVTFGRKRFLIAHKPSNHYLVCLKLYFVVIMWVVMGY